MPKLAIKESEPFEETQGPLLEVGEVYEAEITGFNEFEGKFGTTIAWQLAVDDPEESEPVEAVIFTSNSTNLQDGDLTADKTSNLLKYSAIFNGGSLPLDDDGDFDYELLVGARARIIAKHYPSKNDPSIQKNKAGTVLPLKKSKK